MNTLTLMTDFACFIGIIAALASFAVSQYAHQHAPASVPDCITSYAEAVLAVPIAILGLAVAWTSKDAPTATAITQMQPLLVFMMAFAVMGWKFAKAISVKPVKKPPASADCG